MRRILVAAMVLAGALCAASASAATSFGKLFVFGDSLVDSGNAQAGRLAAGGVDPAPAAAGYYQGRFSNGYNFADYLALGLTGAPATAFAYGGGNFAVGGAQAAEVAGDASPSFAEQIGLFAGSGQTFGADSLVLVTFGGNDVRTELARTATIDGYQPSLVPALAAFRDGLTALIGQGARNIVVTGLPDIGQIPAVTQLGSPALSALGTRLSSGLNQAFDQTTVGFAARTGLNLRFFDLFGYQASIYADPAAFGLPASLDRSNVCLQVSGAAPGCEGYVYFDTIHPTTRLHSVIADGIFAQAVAVPEPATWVMLVVGFGLAGGAVRRRGGAGLSIA